MKLLTSFFLKHVLLNSESNRVEGPPSKRRKVVPMNLIDGDDDVEVRVVENDNSEDNLKNEFDFKLCVCLLF